MAGISRDLTLIDKFSSVFDRFINRAEKAEQAVEKISGDAVTQTVDKLEEVSKRLVVSNERNIDVIRRLQRDYKAAFTQFGPESEKAQAALEILENELERLGFMFNETKKATKSGMFKDVNQMPLDKILQTYDLTTLINEKLVTFKKDLKDFVLVWEEIPPKIEEVVSDIDDIPDKVEAASVATEVWQDYLNRLDVTLPGITGRLENMWLTAVRFEKQFGADSEYAIEAQRRFDEALKESGLTMEQLKERLEEARIAQKKLGDDGEEAARKSERAHSKLGRTLTRLGVMLFGLRKIVQAVKNAMARVPDEIMKPFNSLKSLLQDDLARVTTSLFAGMQKGLDRLNQAFESPAGRNFIAALQVGFEALGTVIGFIAEQVAGFMEFLWEQIEKLEINWQAVGEFIGKVFGAVYVTAHNIFAAMYNFIASVAEAIANAFKHPEHIIISIIQAIANFALDTLGVIARAIDKVFGSSIAGTLAGWQDSVNAWAESKYSDDRIKLDRMDMIEYDDYMAKFGAIGANFGSKFESAISGGVALNAIKASSAETAAHTKAIKDAVTDEDLKMLIDVATQKFVSNVNLTAQTPVITINGANTGNTEADRRALAKAIKDILEEQMASGSTSGYYVYAGV